MKKVAIMAGREVMLGFRSVDIHLPRLNWLQQLLSKSSVSQQQRPALSPQHGIIAMGHQWQIDYTRLLPSWKGQCFVFT